MATILQTDTQLDIINDSFSLVSTYSGETNPNVTFEALFNVVDSGLNALEGASISIGAEEYFTDVNGQSRIDLMRGDYTATVSLAGYIPQNVQFTIIDSNIVNNVTLGSAGSFDNSFDNSFEIGSA